MDIFVCSGSVGAERENIFKYLESTMGLASIEKYSTPYEILQILDYMFTDIFVFSDILIFKIFTAYEI